MGRIGFQEMLDQGRQTVADLASDLFGFFRFSYLRHELGERYGHRLEQEFRIEAGIVGLGRQRQERVGRSGQRYCFTRLTKRGKIDRIRHSSSMWQST